MTEKSEEKIAFAYGIPYVRIDSLAGIGEKLGRVLEGEGPVVCEAVVDPGQNFEPKVSSKVSILLMTEKSEPKAQIILTFY